MSYKYKSNLRHLFSSYSYNDIVRIHRVYCKSVSGPNEKFQIDESQSQHLIKALRLKEGVVVEVFDGMANLQVVRILKILKKFIEVERIESINIKPLDERLLVTIMESWKKNNLDIS